jgi:hypothetical protein
VRAKGRYAVRHGSQPVNDFCSPRVRDEQRTSDPETETDWKQGNFFEKVFPCLYPYGVGGIEAKRQVEITFCKHVQWSLQYHDCHFQKHETFPFAAFRILQKCQALGSARVQMCRKNLTKMHGLCV